MTVNVEIRAQVGRVSDNDNGTADVEVQLVAGKHVVIHTTVIEMVRPFAAAFRVQAGALALADMLTNGADPRGERTGLGPTEDEEAKAAEEAEAAKLEAEAAAARTTEANAVGAASDGEGGPGNGDEGEANEPAPAPAKKPAKKKAAAKKQKKDPVTPPE